MSSFFRPSIPVIALLFATSSAALAWIITSENQSTALIEIQSADFYKVYLVPEPQALQIEVHLVVQSGEADLTGIEGQAHYVEHLAWLSAIGTGVRLADRHTNAWTTSDATGYWMTGSSTSLGSLLATIVKTLSPPKLDREFAEAERGIILREYDFRVRGSKYARIEDLIDKALYENTHYTRSVGGVPSGIEIYSVENALKIHAKTHIPSNSVLVISGAVTETEIETALSKIPLDSSRKTDTAGKTPKPITAAYITENSSERVNIEETGLVPELIWQKIIKLKKPIAYDLLETRVALLHDILDTNLPGGIAKPLRFDAFIAESYGFSLTALDEEFIEIRFSARPDKGINLSELRVAFEAALEASAKDTVPIETFDRVLRRFETYWPDWDDPSKVADWMKNYTLERVGDRRVPLYPEAIKRLNERMDHDSINQLLASIAGPGRVRFVEIGAKP